ncbi:MAG: UDPGP type 1 family protein [Ruminococcus sp.]|nr:UDPGP type 1 family protein [Ruminococcus sp.]
MLNYESAERILSEYGQKHILRYYNELSDEEKQKLLSQIELVDFSVLSSLNDMDDVHSERGNFEPLGAVTIEEIDRNREKFTEAGISAIKEGKMAAVLLAGGQGTRLGFDKPKGMFNIGVQRELYIFECLINNLMDVVKQSGAWVPLYIMTSEKNNRDTVEFFAEKNYFGYNKDYVKFFIQDMAPSADYSGKILMESKSEISMSPNGNGGWFSSMVRAGLLNEIKSNGIEWINVFAVDNVLQRIADPSFLGAVLLSGCESGGKVVSKADPDERVGVLCLENGMPSIVEYYEMTEEMRTRREPDGRLSYNYGVILNYIFNVDKLEKIVDDKMPIHVVEKKIPYMNEGGELVNPENPNGYKFETLVLDMVHMQDSCLSYEVVRDREFAPVKNAEGVDSVVTARELLKKNGVKL